MQSINVVLKNMISIQIKAEKFVMEGTEWVFEDDNKEIVARIAIADVTAIVRDSALMMLTRPK